MNYLDIFRVFVGIIFLLEKHLLSHIAIFDRRRYISYNTNILSLQKIILQMGKGRQALSDGEAEFNNLWEPPRIEVMFCH